jgi:hypothetical protein
MYAVITDGNVSQVTSMPRRIKIKGNSYPASIFTKWSEEDRQKVGLVTVKTVGSHKSDTFYTNSEEFVVVDGTKVERRITNAAKNIDSIKTVLKDQINSTLYNALIRTDWIVIRKADVDKDIPSNIVKWRTDLREKATELETLVNAKSTVGELEAITIITKEEIDNGKKVSVFYDWPEDPRKE